MRKLALLVAILVVLTSLGALAQPQAFLSIPSSGFTPQVAIGELSGDDHFEILDYSGNPTGTARIFGRFNLKMFAPVNLPHRATVTSLRCAGTDQSTAFRIQFTLRRNEPQQANVDMATVMTTFEETGFQSVITTSITEPVVNNAVFNYYIVATLDPNSTSRPNDASINFCRIGYTMSE